MSISIGYVRESKAMTQGSTVAIPREYLENLEKKVNDLNSLLEVLFIISSTLDFADLITLVMEKAKKVMNAEACSILMHNKETHKLEFSVALCQVEPTSETLKDKVSLDMGEGIAGWVAEHEKTIIVEDTRTDSRFCGKADKMTGFDTKSLIAAPLIGRSGLIGVAEVLNSRSKDSFSRYDAEIFETLCRQIAIAIENATFHRASVEREKIRRELEIAAVVQKSFLPESPVLKKGDITVSAVNISASQVGGDIYDFIEYDSSRVGILIGDVSGKGVSAALFMAKIISEFRYIVRLSESTGDTLKHLNSRLSSAPRGMFLTCMYIIADSTTGALQVSVAGHPPFMRISRGQVDVIALPAGPPLGILPADYSTETLFLQKGDRLVLLTDGAFDAKSRDGVRIGFDRLAGFIKDNEGKKNLIQFITSYVDDYSRGVERADDLTLVEIRKD